MQNKIKNNLLVVVLLGLITSSVFAEQVMTQPVNSQPAVTSPTTTPLAPQEQSASQYLIELPVSDYGDAMRQQSFIQAFSLVLVEKSNNPKIVELSAIKEALAKPELYIRQFNYINKSVAPNPQALFLQINFDPKAISQLLLRSSKVKWVKSKPSVLVWLAKDGGKGKVLVGENSDDELMQLVRKKAKEFGVTMTLPIGDLQDINQVKSQDICNFNLDAVKAASHRYGSPLIALGCIKQTLLGSVWSTKWLLLQGAKSDRFSFIGTSADDVITQALKWIANNIADVTTPVVRQNAKVVMRIINVNGLDQYNEVTRYLHALSKLVTRVDLMNITATDIELAINVVGGEQALLDALKMQDKLVPNPDVTASPPGIDLDYKWVTLDNEKSQATGAGPLS